MPPLEAWPVQVLSIMDEKIEVYDPDLLQNRISILRQDPGRPVLVQQSSKGARLPACLPAFLPACSELPLSRHHPCCLLQGDGRPAGPGGQP